VVFFVGLTALALGLAGLFVGPLGRVDGGGAMPVVSVSATTPDPAEGTESDGGAVDAANPQSAVTIVEGPESGSDPLADAIGLAAAVEAVPAAATDNLSVAPR
jgi:hypothetical protein